MSFSCLVWLLKNLIFKVKMSYKLILMLVDGEELVFVQTEERMRLAIIMMLVRLSNVPMVK